MTARLVRIFGTVVEFHGGIVNLPCADVRIPILPVIGWIIFGWLKCDLNIHFSKYFYGQTSSNFLAVKKLILYKNERMNNLTSFNLLSIKLVFLRNKINQIIVSWIEKSVALWCTVFIFIIIGRETYTAGLNIELTHRMPWWPILSRVTPPTSCDL